MTAKIPPHSIEAEEGLLGCMLLDGRKLIARCVAEALPISAFYSAQNRIIYQKICAVHLRGDEIDPGVLRIELAAAGQLESAGGENHLSQIVAQVPTTALERQYLDKVRELHARRELLRAIQEITERVDDPQTSPDDLVDAIHLQGERFKSISSGAKTKGFTVWRPSDFEKHVAPLDDGILGEAGGPVYWRDRELALVLERVATQRADVVETAFLDGKIEIAGFSLT